MKNWLKWRIKIILTNLGFWRFFQEAKMFYRYLARKPHENDFRFFSHFKYTTGAFVDIGANIGQSAVSFAIFNKNAPIYSFEPNPALKIYFPFVQKIIGKRLIFFNFGLSDSTSSLSFFIPVVNGYELTEEGTFYKSNLIDDPVTRERINTFPKSLKLKIKEIKQKILRFDDLEIPIPPEFIKIDVQGLEIEVLKGMADSLHKYLPILMIENSELFPRLRSLLGEFGYNPYRYSYSSDKVYYIENQAKCENIFFIPDKKIPDLKKMGLL